MSILAPIAPRYGLSCPCRRESRAWSVCADPTYEPKHLLILIFGGGGGYYAHGRYGTAGLGGVLGVVLIVLIALWLVGGIGTYGPRP